VIESTGSVDSGRWAGLPYTADGVTGRWGVLKVALAGHLSRSLDVRAPASVTFGRSPSTDLPLGTDDPSISRVAGEIVAADDGWVVRNRSSSRPLHRIDDTGLRVAIPVGSCHRLVDPTTRIVVVGSIHTHLITLVQQVGAEPVRSPETHVTDDENTVRPVLTSNERRAAVALVEGYLLDPPRHDPHPRTYAEAAERLALPSATVRKRIENVRSKLIDCGVVELQQPDARSALAEFLLSSRLVTADDLDLLDEAT
jgi:hypothetical protein